MQNRIELEEKVHGFSERDFHSKALINTDKNALIAYKKQKSRSLMMKTASQDIENVKEQLSDLTAEMAEIKAMLKKLIQDGR